MKTAFALAAQVILTITGASAAAVAAVSAEAVSVFEGPFNITSTEWYKETLGGTLQKRDFCGGGRGTYAISTANALISELQSRGGDAYLPAGSVTSWTRSDLRICTYNRYVFENTHVSNWEQGWGAQAVQNTCCNPGGNPSCAGGQVTGHGDSGLAVDIRTMNSAYGC